MSLAFTAAVKILLTGPIPFLLKPWALSPPPLYPDQPLLATYPPVFRAPFKALLDVEMVYGSSCC